MNDDNPYRSPQAHGEGVASVDWPIWLGLIGTGVMSLALTWRLFWMAYGVDSQPVNAFYFGWALWTASIALRLLEHFRAL